MNIHNLFKGTMLAGRRIIASLLSSLVVLGCLDSNDKTTPEHLSEKSAAGHDSIAVFVDSSAGKTWNIFGLTIVGKVMSEQTNGSYAVVMSTTPPDGGPPLHVHENEDELFYVVEGKYEFTCGEERFVATKGALLHLPRGIPHRFRNIGQTPGVLMNTITPGGFEHFFDEIDQLPKDEPLDRSQVSAIARRYGLRFLQVDEK